VEKQRAAIHQICGDCDQFYFEDEAVKDSAEIKKNNLPFSSAILQVWDYDSIWAMK